MLFVAALTLPASVGAQRAGVGTTDPRRPLDQADMGPPQMPEAKQMERSTPAAVLLDKKKLALTGSQVAFLTGLRKITADSNARNEWARTEAAKVLTEAQLPRAKDYWADEEEQDQKWFRPRGRSGGGGGGGRRPLGV